MVLTFNQRVVWPKCSKEGHKTKTCHYNLGPRWPKRSDHLIPTSPTTTTLDPPTASTATISPTTTKPPKTPKIHPRTQTLKIPTMSTPPPPSQPPQQQQQQNSPPNNSNPTPQTTKKPQPIPWTHQETVHLIHAYQEKWYSLKRGQLKSSQWEEVAVTVAVRCGYDHDHPSKSALQCRHKMEKLRKRYREEGPNLPPHRGSSWPYFELMDAMERGPFPISAHPMNLIPRRIGSSNVASGFSSKNVMHYNEDRENEQDDEEEDNGYRSRSRSINYILRKPAIVNRFAANDAGKPKVVQRFVGSEPREEELFMSGRKRGRAEMDVEEEEEEEVGRGIRRGFEKTGVGASGLGLVVKEVRALAERMMIIESRKMEIMKETERWRMEMENKRLEMILDSQKKVVEMIVESFGSSDGDDEF